MIVCDPTELRISSPIKELTSVMHKMPGFEAATGADIGIIKGGFHTASLNNDKAEIVGRLLWSELSYAEIANQVGIKIPEAIRIAEFWKLSMEGMLVQRKSGNDILNSVDRLAMILERMMVWTRRPWLLVTGHIRCLPNGVVAINGVPSKFSYNALQGALDVWQERGGYLSVLEKDSVIDEWLKRSDQRMAGNNPDKIIYFRKPNQTIVGPEDKNAWVATLTTFKGIGPELAMRIARHCGSLAKSIEFLSDANSASAKDKPRGFGVVIGQYARERLGLDIDQKMTIINEREHE